MFVSADDMNSSMNIVQTYQGGIGMGQRDYYLENDEQTKSIRDKYKEHLVKMFQLAGYDEATAQKAMVAVMNIETRLAKAARSQVELRDPHANYNKMDMETLKKNFPTFNWDAYFTTSGLNDLKEVNVGQPAAMKEVADVINTVPLEDQKFYLQWNLIDAAASFLSDDFVAQNFDFYSRTMSGKKEMQPRWKRAVSTVDGSLGEVVGQMYVEKYFPAAAKERMVGLVKNLQTSLGERIKPHRQQAAVCGVGICHRHLLLCVCPLSFSHRAIFGACAANVASIFTTCHPCSVRAFITRSSSVRLEMFRKALSQSGNSLPISSKPAAPSRASITAWVSTSASECPSKPRSCGMSTPPMMQRRPSTSW